MSLILKGIDMPTNGETLIVGIYGDGNVSIEYSKPLVLAIEPTVKAIQISKRHGRLIDADKIFTYSHWEEQAVSEAPTILEAEE